jgi:hypothetical protein
MPTACTRRLALAWAILELSAARQRERPGATAASSLQRERQHGQVRGAMSIYVDQSALHKRINASGGVQDEPLALQRKR